MASARRSAAPAFYNPCFELLHSVTVDAVIPKDRVLISVTTDSTIEATLKLLDDKRILSVPVFDPNGGYVGLVDYVALMKFTLNKFAKACCPKAQVASTGEAPKVAGSCGHAAKGERTCEKFSCCPSTCEPECQSVHWEQLKGKGAECPRNTKMGDVLSFLCPAKCSKLCDCTGQLMVFAQDSAAKLARAFSKGAHRAVVADRTGKVVNIVSQTDLLQFVRRKMGQTNYRDLGDLTAFDLTQFSAPTVTIDADEPLARAVHELAVKNVTCLAVTTNGKIVGNFSASDFAGIFAEWPYFSGSVIDYLKKYHPNSCTPLLCLADLGLKELLDEMLENKVHRIHMVDSVESILPLKVISMTDVLEGLKDMRVLHPTSVFQQGDAGFVMQMEMTELAPPTTFPFSLLEDMLQPMFISLQADLLSQLPQALASGPKAKTKAKTIKLDVFETRASLFIEAVVTGLTKRDITLSVADNSITISTPRKPSLMPSGVMATHLREISSEPCTRTFQLPAGRKWDLENISAKLENGILEISCPKLTS